MANRVAGLEMELACHLENQGEQGTEITGTDAAICARALRYYAGKTARRYGLAFLVGLPLVLIGMGMSDFDGNGKSLVADLTAAAFVVAKADGPPKLPTIMEGLAQVELLSSKRARERCSLRGESEAD